MPLIGPKHRFLRHPLLHLNNYTINVIKHTTTYYIVKTSNNDGDSSLFGEKNKCYVEKIDLTSNQLLFLLIPTTGPHLIKFEFLINIMNTTW